MTPLGGGKGAGGRVLAVAGSCHWRRHWRVWRQLTTEAGGGPGALPSEAPSEGASGIGATAATTADHGCAGPVVARPDDRAAHPRKISLERTHRPSRGPL